MNALRSSDDRNTHPFAQTFLYHLAVMTKLLSIFLAKPKRLTLKFILCSFQGTLISRQVSLPTLDIAILSGALEVSLHETSLVVRFDGLFRLKLGVFASRNSTWVLRGSVFELCYPTPFPEV